MPYTQGENLSTSASQTANANPWLAHSVRVRSVLQETPGVATYQLEFTDDTVGREFRFSPGQFNMLYVPGVGEAAISISGATQTANVLHHTIREVGDVTRAIARAGRGMSLGLRGPFGSSWPIEACLQSSSNRVHKKDVVVVAGGIGLAPLRSAIYSLCHHRSDVGRIVVMVGARTPSDLLYYDEYPQWKDQGIEIQTAVDRASEDWRGNVGVVTSLLNRLVLANPANCMVMTCGPEVMMRYVVQSAIHRKITTDNIWVSLERNMNCAVGLCGHCQLGPEFLCKDGPVLPYSRVANWLKVEAF